MPEISPEEAKIIAREVAESMQLAVAQMRYTSIELNREAMLRAAARSRLRHLEKLRERIAQEGLSVEE